MRAVRDRGRDMEPTEQEVTAFVDALGGGRDASLEELFAAAYDELRGVAHAQRRNWLGLETLSTTALVHEAYLRLSKSAALDWQDRGHFFRIAARAMRFILINHVERARTAKRGGQSAHVTAEDALLVDESQVEELLALDQALVRLADWNSRWAQVVECRIFAGLSVEETAEALSVSSPTVKRDWRHAQSWLYRELAPRQAGATNDEERRS